MSASPQTAVWKDEPKSALKRRNQAVAELTRTSDGTTFRVSGDCMSPLLVAGEEVEVVPSWMYLPGNVVAFISADGRLFVHRVLGYDLRSRRLHFVTGSDASSGFDDPVPKVNILGSVTAVVGPEENQRRTLRVPLSARLRAVRRFAGLAGSAARRRGSRFFRQEEKDVR